MVKAFKSTTLTHNAIEEREEIDTPRFRSNIYQFNFF